jgi:hypothetical protein
VLATGNAIQRYSTHVGKGAKDAEIVLEQDKVIDIKEKLKGENNSGTYMVVDRLVLVSGCR